MENSRDILIVVPCFNEAIRLPVIEFEKFIEANSHLIDFLFVNDGSTDETLNVLQTFEKKYSERIQILNLDKNVGKAEAVRQGILSAKSLGDYKYVGYLDADLATPLDQILKLQSYLDNSSLLTFVFGSRMAKLGSNIQRKAYRHYFGRVIATMISVELKMVVYDTHVA